MSAEPAPSDAFSVMESQVNDLSPAISTEWQRATTEACEYARDNGLILKYETICPRRCLGEGAEILRRQRDTGLTSDAHLPTFASQYSASVRESFPTTRGAQKILSAITQPSDKAELDECAEEISGNATRKLKLELPLLSSDHEADCRVFRREMEAISAPQIEDRRRLPLDPADPETDEGLEFPPSSVHMVDQMSGGSEVETINVSRDLMGYLSTQLKMDEWTPEDQIRLIQDQLTYDRSRERGPLTPPLSPMLLPDAVYVPDGDACQIPSDCILHLSQDLGATEDALFQQDQIENPDQSVNMASPNDFYPNPPPTSPRDSSVLKTRKLDDIKVEVPLISDCKGSNSDRFPVDLNFTESIERSSLSSLDLPDDLFDPELKTRLDRVATETMRRVEQEKLQVADAVARVTVPVMDFPAPEPPWNGTQQSPLSAFQGMRKNDPETFELPPWPKNRLAEGRMTWHLGPSKAAISTDESVGCSNELLSSFLDCPDADEVAASMQPNRECTKLLVLKDADADDDDEIEPMVAKSKTGALSDFTDAAKKRKTSGGGQRYGISGSYVTGDDSNVNRLKALSAGLIGSPSTLLIGDGPGATSSLLSNYIELRAPHMVLQRSRFFDVPEKPMEVPSRRETLGVCEEAQGVPISLPEAPFPAFDASTTPAKVVISVGLARGITSRLETLLPKLSFVERDYSAYNNSVWRDRSVRRPGLISPLAYDADIVISPASGIVITTMVKVRQKPISGSQGTTVFRHRIDRISERYERLVVLVSEGTNDGSETMGEMSPSDVLAFAELQGFLSGLDSTITAYYVGGGELTVARWAASFICRTEECRDLGPFLIDSETYWELFLRRAGVNVYGAQVIAGSLRVSDAALGDAGGSGLAAFIRMTPEERLERFKTIFGGRRVLQRVNRVVDQVWP